MSRGPGRIERAIRQLLDAHPDLAFTTDGLAEHCYAGARVWLERKQRVAVTRALHKVVASDPDWRTQWAWTQGHMLICYNAASLKSVAMGRLYTTRAQLPAQLIDDKWRREEADRIRGEVADHVAMRDAGPAEREQLKAQRQARLILNHHAASIRFLAKPLQVLSNYANAGSTTLNPDPATVAIADRIRALAAQNDPDVLRAGLAAVAAELDA